MAEKQPAAFQSHSKYCWDVTLTWRGTFHFLTLSWRSRRQRLGLSIISAGRSGAGLLPAAVPGVTVRPASPRCSQRMLPLQPRGSRGGCGAQPVLRRMTHAHRGYVPFVFCAVKTAWVADMKVKETTRMHSALTEQFDVVRREEFEIEWCDEVGGDGDDNDDDQLHIYSLNFTSQYISFEILFSVLSLLIKNRSSFLAAVHFLLNLFIFIWC